MKSQCKAKVLEKCANVKAWHTNLLFPSSSPWGKTCLIEESIQLGRPQQTSGLFEDNGYKMLQSQTNNGLSGSVRVSEREEESDVGGRGIWWNLGNWGILAVEKGKKHNYSQVLYFKKLITTLYGYPTYPTYMTVTVFLRIRFDLGFHHFVFCTLYTIFEMLLLVHMYSSNLRVCLFGLNGVQPSSPSQTFYTIKRHPYLGFWP